MKGYFACPLASGREHTKAEELVLFIEGHGHDILDRHVIAPEGKAAEWFYENSGLEYNKFNARKQDLIWVLEADFFIADYTNGSWGGGVEFDHATVVRKLMGLPPIPILCLKEHGRGSWLIEGIDPKEFPNMWTREYSNLGDAKVIIAEFLKSFS